MSGAIPACSSVRSSSAPSRNEPTVQPSNASSCTRPHAQRHAGDHAERALRAEHQLTQRRARRRRGCVERRQRADGRDALERDDLLVDAPVPGRALAGRARGRAAADRRPLVALRDVAEREAVRAQRRVGLRQPDARLEDRDPRMLVDAQHAVQPPEVERDQRVEAPALPRQAADDARPAAERHDRDALLRAGVQDGRQRLDVARRDDRVGRGVEVPGALRPAGRGRTCRGSAARAPRASSRSSASDASRSRARGESAGAGSESSRPPASRPPSPEIPSSSRSSGTACSGSEGPAPGSPHPQKTCSRLTPRRTG